MSANSAANTPTRLVQHILANLTGNATSLNQTSCQKPDDLENESKHVRTRDLTETPPPQGLPALV